VNESAYICGDPAGSVDVSRAGGTSVVTLNRPAARNALSQVMLRQLLDALAAATADEATAATILTGRGSAFCAGDDLLEAATRDASAFDRNIALLQRATQALHSSPKPTVAAINGPAVGAGLELTLMCDIRLAAKGAQFSCPEVSWGLVVTNGASRLLPAVIGHGRAMEMVLTGRRYDAAWAQRSGLVTEVLPAGRLLRRAEEVASDLASQRVAIGLTRQLLDATGEQGLADILNRESQAASTARRSAAGEAGLRAFRESFG
jgi:enoyl-CoA hydratase/carnithine racemase